MVEPSYVRATRAGYDAVAADYSAWVSDDLAVKPLDRALLAAFAELVHADGAEPVGDLGCGSGRVTAHLWSLGLSAFGVDLSPAMVALARRAYPDLRFYEGSITAAELGSDLLAQVLQRHDEVQSTQELRDDDVVASVQVHASHLDCHVTGQQPGLGRSVKPSPEQSPHAVDVEARVSG
ncbi:MAG: class I SAM-dependent methyltransferase [Pseudonocardiaceae bacterium]